MYIHRSFHLSDDNVMLSPISNVYARHLIMSQSLSSDETEMKHATHSDPKRDRMLGILGRRRCIRRSLIIMRREAAEITGTRITCPRHVKRNETRDAASFARKTRIK